MTENPRPWVPALLIVACLISAGNVGLYVLLSKRFTALESVISSTHGPRSADAASGETPAPPLPDASYVSGHASSQNWNDPGRLAREFRQRKAGFDPVKAAADMDRLMAQEPSIPAIEQTQSRLLQQAIQAMPADAPRPAGLQVSCKGRRCLISAGFMDDVQATEWAERLMLTGGKNIPRSARIIPVPLEGGNGATSLQMYLF